MGESFPLNQWDLLAGAFFVATWMFFGLATDGRLFSRVSLTQAMNRQREAWMRTMAQRELRMIDTSILNGLQQGTAFFASSSLIAMGGCFALLGSRDLVHSVLGALPYVQDPAPGEFELKALGLAVLMAHAFFKFGWAYRLFNYCSILIGAVPLIAAETTASADLDAAVARAAKMNILAGKHFNAGLRGIFFSIAYLGWFIGPIALTVSTLVLLAVLVRRQFFSAARRTVIDATT